MRFDWKIAGGIVALVLVSAQDADRRTETVELPDGSTETYEVAIDAEGARVRDGDYRRVHPDGETTAAEGRYENGRRAGSWTTYFESGRRESDGHYRDGERDRTWRFYYDRKQKPLRAKGSYDEGLREGEWTYYLDPGETDAEESGTYEVFDGWAVANRIRARGELRVVPGADLRERHGRWEFRWPDESPMLEARFVHGEPDGEWRFRHCDGTPDPGFAAGPRRAAEAEAKEAVPETAPDLAPLRELLPEEDPELAEAVDGLLAAMETEGAEPPAEASAELRELRRRCPRAVGQVLRHLVAVRLDDPDQAVEGGRIARLLELLAGGRGFGWSAVATPAAVRSNALAIHRWFSLWWLTEDDALFWQLRLARPLEEVPASALHHPPAPPVPAAENAGSVFGHEMEAALDWLVLHQSEDGGWGAAGFQDRCRADAAESRRGRSSGSDVFVCMGAGYEEHDVGVTALALLAFVRSGSTTKAGPYRDAVTKAVLWLATQVQPDGSLAPPVSREFHYSHAIATLALAELIGAGERSPEVRDLLVGAVHYIEAARSSSGGWRYEYPPTGESDTSMTGWMVAALVGARAVGIEPDPGVLTGALEYLAGVTDPVNGRVGYLSVGSGSARIPGVNDDFPVNGTEALTAVALSARLLLGVDPESDELLALGRDLILEAPPERDFRCRSCDMYYWRAATEALRRGSDSSRKWSRAWKEWRGPMRKIAVDSQRNDGHAAGSWDADGPWGMIGGRVYSTAMMALTLLDLER